ncbi:hypothetical protein EG328_004685 [Venturia inaequalis]|nr:hypothetical protein EG328_004685 [Venturia inaequalis]KAE9994250.1 hypothetical protein EG327_000095 [Venturia inaequalis]RDI76654.1 hypothetical protein Vi05172_g13357 [Venturia inaequalis]
MGNTSAPTKLQSPPLTLASIETDMAPRNVAPEPSSIVVEWHGVSSSICASRWSMLPDRWSTVNNDHVVDLKAMIANAFAFRQVVDDASAYADEPTHTRAAADALRTLLMNPLLHTLYSDIFKKVAKSPMKTKVRDWQDKRHSELIPIMEDFTTQVGHPSAPLATFASHGFSFSPSSSDHFLAARVRFLAAYERVYSTDQPMGEKQRKIRLPKPLSTTFDDLQHIHHQEQGWLVKNPDAEGGEDSRHSSFAVALWANQMIARAHSDTKMDSKLPVKQKDTWAKRWSKERKYNWWIPLTSTKTDMRIAHDQMVSHGITLFSAVMAYGTGPIELSDTTRHIEHTVNLCMAHIETFWQLTQAGIAEKEWVEKKKHKERQRRMGDVQYSMAICEQTKRDLDKARMIAPERVTRGSRRVSDGAGGG